MTGYTLSICPVCGDQVEPDYEEGRTCFHEEFGGYVEPVEVDALPDAAQLQSRQALALFRLQEDRREADFRLAARRWYENLSVADRFWEDERRKRVRQQEIEAMSPMGRAMASMVDDYTGSLIAQMKAGLIAQMKGRSLPSPDLDNWLAEESDIAEVTEALGL